MTPLSAITFSAATTLHIWGASTKSLPLLHSAGPFCPHLWVLPAHSSCALTRLRISLRLAGITEQNDSFTRPISSTDLSLRAGKDLLAWGFPGLWDCGCSHQCAAPSQVRVQSRLFWTTLVEHRRGLRYTACSLHISALSAPNILSLIIEARLTPCRRPTAITAAKDKWAQAMTRRI